MALSCQISSKSAKFDAIRIVHIQEIRCSDSDHSYPFDDPINDLEVIWPVVRSRIEQSDQITVHERRKVRAFEQIAPMAGKTQIFDFVAATMLSSDDVLDMERHQRKVALGKLTILTAT